MSTGAKVDDMIAAGATGEDLDRLTREPLAPWPEPRPLPPGLQPVPAFDARLLPPVLRPWVMDIVERVQCPPEFVAVSAITMLAAVVGRQCGIHPKRHDDWLVVPNLWALVVGRPGILKTPALEESLRPLRHLTHSALESYERAMAAYGFQEFAVGARRAGLKKQIEKMAQNGANAETLRAEYEALAITPPAERRYIVNDPTVEKLGALLTENPNGLLLYRDELHGFLATMDRQGHENDRSFYCEAWAGTGSYTYDRIGRGTLHVPAACVSILGGIQPGRLAGYLREMYSGHGDDGLLQRFQLAVYPDVSSEWNNVDRFPDTKARQRVSDVIATLHTLDPAALGATAGPGAIPYLHFSEAAQAVADQWREELERKVRDNDGDHPVIVSHLAKYRSLMPSLALLFHLTDVVDSPAAGAVPLASVELATAWCDFLEAHARRIYQSLTAGVDLAVVQLAKKIRARKVGADFRARDVYRQEWAGLADPESVEKALGVLVELGWLRRDEEPPSQAGGRPTVRYTVNPKVLKDAP